MNKDTKEIIGFPAGLLLVIFACYGLLKLLMSLPSAATAEGVLGGMLIIGFIGVPLFFGTLFCLVAICLWMSTSDDKP